jgi:Spy/CpxP family protein refolding chaperone
VGPPPGPPMGRNLAAIRQYLGLTDDQIQQVQRTRDAAREGTRGVADQLRAKEAELRALVQSGAAEPAAVGKVALEVEALRTQMQQLAETARQNLLALLSSEQAARVRTLEEAAKLRPAIDEAAGLGLLDQGPPQQGPPRGGPER